MNNALSNNRPTRGRDDASMYDVSTYTDVELFNILDLDSPTDRELEAKIIFLINKYKNIQNASGDQLAEFFEKIYRRFFETEDETDNFENEEDEDAEEFANIREGLSNQEIVKSTPSPANKVTNVENTTSTSSAITVKPTVQENSVVKQSPDNIGYIKSLEYANGKLNPLLQQTIKRIISIDSQYRDDKRTLSTEFTFNLSDPLKDVVSLKLYSVQIPYTWYTINNNFGSNFFVLKGDVDGINNGNHDYQIEIAAGNYSPQGLNDTINDSINRAKTTYPDVSFGNTYLSYNSNTSLITTTLDLYKQYNETSYYLNFPNTWSGVDNSGIRLSTIPGFLGFTQAKYEMFHLESARTLPLSTDTANESTRFAINSNNNYFTIYKYIGDEYGVNQLGKRIDLSWNIVIGLADGSYTRSQITTALNSAIQSNRYLSTSETLIERKSGIQRIDLSNNSYFLLKLKTNRYTTNNVSGSKLQIKFPSDTIIWTGSNSCFQFNQSSSLVMEMNNITSEQSPLQQSDDKFKIQSSPYISLTCNKAGYNVSTNSYRINVENAITVPYNLTNYIAAINAGFRTADNSSNFTIDNTYVKIDGQNTFNAQIDLTKNITTSRFKIDLTTSFLHTYLGFDTSYNLDTSGGIYTATFNFLENYPIPDTGNLAILRARIAGEYMTSDLSYVVKHPINTNTNDNTTPYLSGFNRILENTINQQFDSFKDSDGVNVLRGTTISLTVGQNNIATATLTVFVNKQLTEADYSIQFLEENPVYDTWYKNLKISREMIDTSWDLSQSATTSAGLSFSTTNTNGSVALGIKGGDRIAQNEFACTSTNNTFELIPYEEGVVSTTNNLIFTLPLKNTDGTTITYTRTRLLEEINRQFIGTIAEGSTVSIMLSDTGVEYTKFRITINKEYTSKDYRIVYYDPYSFVKCFSGVNSVRNVTWDTTLGWILGYRLSTIYYLSDYTSNRTAIITADTCISTNLFNYFLITLDDYNQNHLNDGLVTVTAKDTDIPLPSYANRTNYTCDPVTKELTYNTEQRTDYSKLTQNQIYALNQVANSKNVSSTQVTAGEVSSKNYGSGPFAKDVFGIIPLKLPGLQNGSSYVEFGGTLQNQERIYFGPVNIHRMSVKLLSDRGNVVDLNGANWSFSLVCEQLYRPQQSGTK